MGSEILLGIDEVGRGCLAGPLVIAGVAFSIGKEMNGLNDSKQLSKRQRQAVMPKILDEADFVRITWVSASEIDRIGLGAAMEYACEQIFSDFSNTDAPIIIDGNVNYLNRHSKRAKAVIGADGMINQVMAASIVAKQARDAYMTMMARKYPLYGFDSHVGYGTAAHIRAIREYGFGPLHRRSYTIRGL
jgi:ribonuclease HII